MRREEEFLRHAAAEIAALAPRQGEEAELDARRRLMQAAEKMRADVARAAAALSPEGAEGMLGDARRWLDGLTDRADGGLDAALAALERAMVELGEAQSEVAGFADRLVFNPAELEETEERLFALRGQARKHGIVVDDLERFGAELEARVAALDGGAEEIASLRAAHKDAVAAWRDAADRLSHARAEAARRLDLAMAGELAPLKLERAVFSTVLAPADPGPTGADAVTFTVATNPGAPAGPLNRIASGGELSRFLLALKVCLTRDDSGLTLIFDEIDRGVGGATADAVGRRLASLSEGGQVLVVTHSPQVAALGAHHWRVSKAVADGMTLSRVEALEPDARIDEVARMLAGDTVTEEARAAARALLAAAAT
jgi:DNA repair protein RecN (Recombination protein N)